MTKIRGESKWAVRATGLFVAALLLCPLTGVSSDRAEIIPARPVITLIIDDLGNHLREGEAALDLAGPITYSFLPHTPYAHKLAERAHAQKKEVMLHLPMDAENGNRLGPGALDLHMTEQQFRRSLREGLESVPYVAGLNNHMGSLLTRHPGAMGWLMEGMKEFGDLYFIDSRTTSKTVAAQMAREKGVPNSSRDIFLDNSRDPEAIRAQFRQLIRLAYLRGRAVGIGHPYPETLAVLREELKQLDDQGVQLVPASQLIHYQRRNIPWQASLSPSPKAAKNSKP